MFEPLTFGFSEEELDMFALVEAFTSPDEFGDLLDAAANALPDVCQPYVCSTEEIEQMVRDEVKFTIVKWGK